MFGRYRYRNNNYDIPPYDPTNPYDPRNQPGGGYDGYGYGGWRHRFYSRPWHHRVLIAVIFTAVAGIIGALAASFILDNTLHDWHAILTFEFAPGMSVESLALSVIHDLGGLIHSIGGGLSGGGQTCVLKNVLGQ